MFTNETIDTTTLPRFETVGFSSLHPSYWKVLLISLAVFFAILGAALAAIIWYVDDFKEFTVQLVAAYFIILAGSVLFSRIGFKKKGFAFRDHDVLFRHGIIATTTIVIPYNRIQHVALHEGLISRSFNLAEVRVFTAGGKESDIEIPGIEKSRAEDIKQLLMGKIQKQL